MATIYKRGKTWWLLWYQDGRKMRKSCETTNRAAAKRQLRVLGGDLEKGPVDPKVGRIIVPDALADVLMDYTTNGKKTAADVKIRIDKHLKPFFGHRRMTAITTSLIREYVAARQTDGASNGTINRELAVLKRSFVLAVQAGKLNTRPHVPMLKEAAARRGFFEPEQFAAVRDQLDEDLRGVVTFAYITGWRTKSEILPLEWRNVDWQAREVRLDPGTTKNGEGRTFPFTAELETLLKSQLADHERLKKAGRIVPLIFQRDGKQIRDFRGAWEGACERAGVPGRLLHDFRRTAVRNLERAGVPRSAAMAMVGHKTESIYRRYAIVDSATLREAAAKIDLVTKTGTIG
jgi:integrase